MLAIAMADAVVQSAGVLQDVMPLLDAITQEPWGFGHVQRAGAWIET